MSIPAGTKFQGIPSTNDDLNLRSAQVNATAPLYDILDIQNEQPVSTLTLQGTTDSTTARAAYGINVVKVTTATDVACRLPLAETGKSCTIINETSLPIIVFPSAAGGSINGAVDGSVVIGTNTPSTFYCTENPLPGSWIQSGPNASQVESAQIEVNFTNGGGDVYKFNSGVTGVANASSVGSGMSGGPSSALSLTGPWTTVAPANGTMAILKIYTNIVVADVATGWIQGNILTAFQSAPSGATSGVRQYHRFQDDGESSVITGGLAYTGEVGDNGTLYYQIPIVGFPGTGAQYLIIGGNYTSGAAGIYSNGYFTYEMGFDNNCVTKLYKFKFFLEYV